MGRARALVRRCLARRTRCRLGRRWCTRRHADLPPASKRKVNRCRARRRRPEWKEKATHPQLWSVRTTRGVTATVTPTRKGSSSVLCTAYAKTAVVAYVDAALRPLRSSACTSPVEWPPSLTACAAAGEGCASAPCGCCAAWAARRSLKPSTARRQPRCERTQSSASRTRSAPMAEMTRKQAAKSAAERTR